MWPSWLGCSGRFVFVICWGWSGHVVAGGGLPLSLDCIDFHCRRPGFAAGLYFW
ncbi:hypothetical protein RHMOL_Rhmol10G0193500 [Rhododendron molle]|uniref:Uncharacterized protein n=1 Tax=Rhododendron molle TaxID=49168 RepID=A0ACC0M3V8_RHOML|nr:hypothetical protein RHMOL_Rhmol10G0193500 [Rhododendron molle]